MGSAMDHACWLSLQRYYRRDSAEVNQKFQNKSRKFAPFSEEKLNNLHNLKILGSDLGGTGANTRIVPASATLNVTEIIKHTRLEK